MGIELLADEVLILVGHYGCGKTSLAVTLAAAAAKKGQAVNLIDLDIVNPYFRSADFCAQLEALGVSVTAPLYAGTGLDIPALSARVDAVLDSEGSVILDMGGDDAGAAVLGRYAEKLVKRPHRMLYLFNSCRYLTSSPEACAETLREIEGAARLAADGLVNSTNLGPETTAELIRGSMGFAEETAKLTRLPLVGTVLPKQLWETLADIPDRIPLELQVRLPWEEQPDNIQKDREE